MVGKRKIRLRLNGARLPKNYTISLRLLPGEDRDTQPPAPSRKRKRKHRPKPVEQVTPPTSDLDDGENDGGGGGGKTAGIVQTASDVETLDTGRQKESSLEEEIRKTNAYPGAVNSINSIYQRRWFLSLDRRASGFIPESSQRGSSEDRGNGRKRWVRKQEKGTGELLGFEAFHVLGREVERSVVTGRLAADVLRDQGVEGYVVRKGWSGIVV